MMTGCLLAQPLQMHSPGIVKCTSPLRPLLLSGRHFINISTENIALEMLHV